MKLLSTYLRGKSLTVCFAFPEDYDMANIDALNVSIGSKQFTGDDIEISGQVACVRLKSEDTYKLTGDYPIIISIDDKTRGVIPIYVGDIRFVTHRNSLNNASTNEENDIVIALSITQTTINVDSVLYDVMAGKAATIEVGTVTTLEAGEDATVENTGTENEAVFNFGIPKGEKGDKGDAGDMFSGQFNTVILKQNCFWVDGWLWIDTGSKTNLKNIEVGYFAINTGIGTEYLKPIVHYPAALTYQTSSVPNGFYLKDVDGRLSENTDFEFLDVRYNIRNDTVYKYDGLTKLNGINAAFDDFDVSHSAAMRTIFLQIYQGFTGEVYRSATDELCNFSRIDAHFEPTYARIRNVDVIGIPIVNAGAMEQSGSNADILKVASHYNNTFARVDITDSPTKFINGVIAITSGPDVENRTVGCTFGNGVEFFEDTIKTSSEYPNFNYESWNPTYQQSATTAIITAKFRMIKDATGASWDIIRRACRATARKTVGGVYAAGFPWDMYRGFGIIHVDGAIQWIKANYTENDDYLNNLADEVERTRGIDPMLPYDKQTDDTPIAKRDFEPVRDKLAGIEDNANNYVHPGTHPPAIIEQDANNRFVTDAEKSAWNGKQNNLGFTPENAANKKTTLTDSDTDYPTTKAVNAGLAGKQNTIGYTPENTVNKQNSLAVDGTGAKYPTVDAVNAGLALKVAYTDSLKYYPTINYANRVLADSGVISDLEKLTKLYIENLKLLDNTVFLWDGSAGIKTRTSGANTFATKLYDMSAGNKDAVQATEANQPHVGGLIAPNEQRKLKGLTGETGTKGVTGADIQIASSGAFTLAIAVKWNYPRTSSRIYLSATNYIELTASDITLRGDSGNVLTCSHNFRVGLTEILAFEYSNGAGLIRVNGVEKTTTATSGAVTFGSLFLNQTSYNFDGEISKLQIANVRLSAAQIQNLYNFTRLQHPEIEGINIGNQHWATSNYEGVVTGNGTVIPEVQGASTATNPELITNGTFDTATGWILAGATTISGGALRVYSPDGSSSFARFNIPTIVVGKRYLLKYDVLQNNGGEISCTDIGSNIIDTTVGVNKTFEFTVADVGYFILKRIGACDVTFDNVSLKAVGWADLTTPAWCYYNNDPLNGAVYGKLYNWYAVQAIAANPPEGWRVPTQADYVQLSNHLGGNSVAGGKMRKEGLYPYYNNENVGATNESGFSGIGCGYRTADGNSTAIRYGLFLHTNSIYTAVLARDTTVLNIQAISEVNKKLGYSLRLIRNEPVGATERNIETGYITNALGATNLDIPIPFGYQVESIRIDSETNITGLSAKLFTGALVELETLFTAKSVTANVQKVIAADADQSIQQTDAVVRINGTKALTSARFRVWVKITKVVFS